MGKRLFSAERHQIVIREVIASIDDVERSMKLYVSLNSSIMLIKSLPRLSVAIR